MDDTRLRFSLADGGRFLPTLKPAALAFVALAAILVLALVLRLYGLDWDQGYSYTPHPDERAILAKVGELSPPAPGDLGSLLNADESTWNPRWFPYGSFPLYLLKGVQLFSGLGTGEGLTDLRIAGRVMSALADVATIAIVFWLGCRAYGRRTGILASLLVALAVIHIQLSHFFAVDTFAALFAVATLYFLYRVATVGSLRDSVLAGVFIGLALATKVSLAPIYAAFVIAHLMYLFSMAGARSEETPPVGERCGSAIKGLAVGAIASLVVLFITQPYAFLDWGRFYEDVVEQSEMVRRIRDYPYTRQYIDTTPYWYHVRQLATWGFGWPLGLVAWAGLLYASVRGTTVKIGLGYLAIGWGLPVAVLLYSTSLPAIVAATGISLAALLATLPYRSSGSRMDVLLLSWVVPYFLITGAFEVKFLRYLMPITPFLILFGSRMLVAVWDRASAWRPGTRPWLVIGLVLLLGSTGFYAVAYLSIYEKPHTAVRAAEWINQNAPAGSTFLKEHWEEALPDMGGFRSQELPLYVADSPLKVRLIAKELANSDYLVFYSNRLYGTIPRLPERYPATGAYYRQLFSGQLGYELVHVESTYPKLFGVRFVEDTFGRPGVPTPSVAGSPLTVSSIPLNLGFADESFSVYDHPKVLVFQNVVGLDAETIQRTIEDAAPALVNLRIEASGLTVGLMLSPRDAATQQEGGTWTDIVQTGSWTNRLPVLAWLIVVEGIALLALPITLVIFRSLPDRGFLLSKALGLLAVTTLVWLLASLHWMAFSRASIAVGLAILALASLLVIARHRRELVDFIRARWPVLMIGEMVFLVAFFSFLMVRMANPDLWHPFRGGEKPMDLAYLNAVLRSSYMPPYDPWFSGGYLNYYYFGQFIVATLIRATGIVPTVAYNLAVPLFFALTAAGAFAVVYNLAEATRRRLARETPEPSDDAALTSDPDRQVEGPDPPEPIESRLTREATAWSPVLAGLGGALFVTVLGNLDGAIQVGRGVWRAISQDLPFGAFDFWRSSRMMPPDPPGHEITEFPFFTFLFGDLHAHMLALPFTLLALGLALAVVMGALHRSGERRGWSTTEVVRLGVLGVVVGSLRLLNAWDFPTYLVIAVASVALAELFAHGGLGFRMIVRSAVSSAVVIAVGYLVYLPFHLSYEAAFNSLEPTTNKTVLWQFLAVTGLFVFIVGSFFVYESRDWLAAALRGIRRRLAYHDGATRGEGGPRTGMRAILAAGLAALLVGFVLAAIFSGALGSTIPFAALLLALVLVAGFRWVVGTRSDSPQLAFVAVIVAVPLALVIGLDVFRVEGDVARMNSVFKFYLQIWVLLAVASAYLLWRLAHGRRSALRRLAPGKMLWLGGLAVLLISAAIYPVLGTQARLRDRFDGRALPLTLDGTAYIQGTTYHDIEGDIDLAADYEGIKWLRENIQGSPIVLESVTPTYRWGGRVSVYAGLPTVIGWQWHQEQQRWEYRRFVGNRIRDVNEIYSTQSPSKALSHLRKYGVKYIYVGQLERLYYREAGLRKFEGSLSDHLEKVYENTQVTIYRVRDAAF